MNRRTLMYQEALFIMNRLPNYYDRPKGQLTQWQFGYTEKGTDNVKMIHPDSENQTLFQSVPDLFNVDLVIVPLSQVPPEFDNIPVPQKPEEDDGKEQLDNNDQSDQEKIKVLVN
jgi:hypothetical protein